MGECACECKWLHVWVNLGECVGGSGCVGGWVVACMGGSVGAYAGSWERGCVWVRGRVGAKVRVVWVLVCCVACPGIMNRCRT